METYNLKNDLKVFCKTVESFPNGIEATFKTLEKLLPDFQERSFFGIFYLDEKGKMIYKAGASEQLEGETEEYDCETFVLQKGAYLSETINNWRQKEGIIPATFQKLGDAQPDARTPGVEWYNDEDVMCMLKIKD